VHTNGENVDTVEVVRSVQLLDFATRDFLRAWHFGGTESRAFDTTVRFELSAGGHDCNPLTPVEADLEPPLRITVASVPTCISTTDAPGQQDTVRPVGPTIEGSLRCACRERIPIANAEIEVRPTGKRGRTVVTHSDSHGAYTLRDVPDGDYFLSIHAPGFSPIQDVPVLVRKNRPNAKVRENSLSPNSVVVFSSDIPVYPRRALDAGVTGEVHINGVGPEASVVDGDPMLAASALANVLSWKTLGGSGSPLVTFTYSLVDDCENPNPHVTMKLPYEVNVVGKRRTRCIGPPISSTEITASMKPMKPLFHVFHGASW
jgi:hypothetical protein